MNEQGSFVIVNKAFLSVNRTTQEQVVGKTPVELGIITADVQELWSAKFSNQRIVDLEEIYLRDATGVPRCYLLSTREIAIGGRPHTVSSVIDITSHKEAEAKLQEQDRRYKLMVQNLNDLLVVLSEDGTIRFVSSASEPMLGGSPEKLLGQCIFERVYPDDLPLIRSGFDRILAGERRILFPCFRYRQETGAFVHLEASGTNLLDEPSIAGIVFVVRDISERVRSERTTREWKHRYELLSRAAGQVVWDCDIEGRMVWGGCIQETLGYAPEEMLGDLPQWKGRISPEERDAVADKYGAALAAATDFGAEYCFLHKSGHYILVSDRGIPYFDEAGQLKGFVGVLEDVTARRQAEVDHARLEAELRQAQKIESIGRLAGGVAHDFDNLLTAIRGNVSLAMLDVSERDPIQESLKEIDKAAESAANLTRQLLAYSRK